MAPLLWLRGQAQALRLKPRVTVVGSRAASSRGLERAYALGQALVTEGALVISGGALGIDAAAHRGALSASGATCAVLGTGIDRTYPSCHRELFDAIAEKGCLLSMVPPRSPPRRGHFPQRNKLMAALADLVVVVEAQLHSGTGYTAQAAQKFGRQVLCFADSPGTAALVHAGAQPISELDAVFAQLPLAAARRADSPQSVPAAATCLPSQKVVAPISDALSPASRQLLGALCATSDPLDLGELCARSGLSVAECAAAAIELELSGHCSHLPGGRYVGHALSV